MPPKAGPCRAPEHGAGITRNGSPACREREGRHGGGGRRAQLHPQVSMNFPLFLSLFFLLRISAALPRFALPSSPHDDWGGEWRGMLATARRRPADFHTMLWGGGFEYLHDIWMVESCGKAFPCIIYFPLLLPFGSSDWQTSEWGFGSLCPALRQAHIHGRLAD